MALVFLGRGDVVGVCGIGILGQWCDVCVVLVYWGSGVTGVCGIGILGQWCDVCVWCWYFGTVV